MGSGQSSQANSSGSFSIDPSGNISPINKKSTSAPHSQQRAGEAKSQPNSYNDTLEKEELRSSYSRENVDREVDQSSHRQIPTIDEMPRSRDELGIKEADEIVTRMKLKYKPNSAEMAGKNRSAFEDIEKDLVQCYKTNKDLPIKCLELTKQYSKAVADHRTHLLKKSLDIPALS